MKLFAIKLLQNAEKCGMIEKHKKEATSMAQKRKTQEKKSGLIIALLILIILAGAALLGATIFGILKQQQLDQSVVPAATAEPQPEPTAEPTPEPIETLAPTALELYADRLTAYYQAISQRLDAETLREKDLNYMLSYSYGDNAPARFGYLLSDLDGDGAEELLIGCLTGDEYTDEIVLDLYTIRDDAVSRVFTSGERDRYYLCSDGTIANEASASAFESHFRYYTYAGGALALREEYGFDLAANRNDPWFRATADGTKTVITEAEAVAATERYRDSYAAQRYTPFTEISWLKVDTAPDVWQGETNAAEG